ncbi:hypothetical protein E1630_24305 [Salmonella enterica subsp. enterica serovar Baguida]|nr:hypothetical protein [Salmonella enterica subsp. enterica serovar Baguida]
MRDLILQLSKSSIYSTKPHGMQSGASDRTPVKAIWLFNLLFAHHFQRSKAVARARLISTRVYAIRVVSFDLATANPLSSC